jgi:O-Antigen ligase
MEAVAPAEPVRRAGWPGLAARLDPSALSVWALVGGIVLYMSLDGGGYDVVVYSQVGIVVWWIVLIGSAWALLPAARLSRFAWIALALFGAFLGWTALSSTWSLSSERSLQELARVSVYLGVLLLAVSIHRDRELAVRHALAALASAIAFVAGIALLSRLHPGLFSGAQQTASFLSSAQGRLGWPLNYWNALGALVAFGLPLLLAIATSARRIASQALAAGAIPAVALCGYLTFSRGGAIATAVGVIVFFALAPERVPKLGTAFVTVAGSAALIAGAVHRSAIEHGLANAAARHQGDSLLGAVILICAGCAVIQAGLGLAARHGTPPRWLEISPPRARAGLAAATVLVVVVALIAGVPSRLSHAWRDFKHPTAAALSEDSLGRFTTASGNGRYDYWKVAVNASSGHALQGDGAGTYQLVWLPRAPYFSYVRNAHSLYLETLSDVGIVGLALLIAFFATVLWVAATLVVKSRFEARVRAAGAAAALAVFVVAAGYDWIWQVPALPAAFLVLAGAVLAPFGGRLVRGPGVVAMRLIAIVVAIACLVAIAVPLATTNAVRQSQAAASTGDPVKALASARTAARIEPGAASPQLQLALVLELQRDLPAALAAAHRAASDEPQNWGTWLVVSRLEAEVGRPAASVAAFRRARSLNPQSPVFSS